MKRSLAQVVFVLVLLMCGIATAHPGLTDSNNCHTDDNGTNFHCHEPDESESDEVETENSERDVPKSGPSEEEQPTTRRTDQSTTKQPQIVYRDRPAQQGKTVVFDDKRALATMGISISAILLTSAIGAMQSNNKFSSVAGPSVGLALVSTSVFSVQMGLRSKTSIVGGLAVAGNIVLPLILGAAGSSAGN